MEKPDANLRVLALDLLRIMNIFALQGFMEPEGVSAKQKAKALALLIQGNASLSESVSGVCGKFRKNMQWCAEGRCLNEPQKRDRILPPVDPKHREQGILIDGVLFVCVGTHRQGGEGPSFRLIWAVDCPEGSERKGIVGYTMVEDKQLTNAVAVKIKEPFPSSEDMKAGDWHLKSMIAKILSERILFSPAERNTREGRIMDKIALHRALFSELKMKAVRGDCDVRKWETFLIVLAQSLSADGIRVLTDISPGEVESLQSRGQIIVNRRRSAEIDPSQIKGNCVVVLPGYERLDDRKKFGTMEVAVVW